MQKKGFSLIELLVVIGILAILGSLLLLGMGALTQSGHRKTTEMRLQSLAGMLSEYEGQARGFNKQPPEFYYDDGGSISFLMQQDGDKYDIWRDADPRDPAATPLGAPGGVGEEEFRSSVTGNDPKRAARFRSVAVYNTQQVMNMLLSVQGNRAVFEGLPQNALLQNPKLGKPAIGELKLESISDASSKLKPPLVLDGWGNPIIFVPAGGLQTVDRYDTARPYKPGAIVAISTKFYRCDKPGGPAPGTGWSEIAVTASAGIIKSPNARPFFASAGPDGDFYSAEDNMYSFGN